MRTDVLILGGGLGGYETYRRLIRSLKYTKHALKITLVDANTYYTFVPMLHEAATGAVEPMHCAISLRAMVKAPHEFIQATVTKIDPATKKVQTSAGTIEYRWCVVALGSAVNYLQVPGAAKHTYNVRTLTAALRLHHDLISLLENTQKNLAITVIGGGWTGVEIAGQFGQLLKKDLARYFPHKKIKLTLLEGGPAVLSRLDQSVQTQVAARLSKTGVSIRTNEQVKAVSADAITLASGQTIPNDLAVWTTGFENTATCYLPKDLCEKNRLPVNQFLVHASHPQLYAIGDIAYAINPHTNQPYGQLGETAVAQAKFVAKDIVRQLQKKPRRPFVFKTKGSLIPLGDWDGVAIIGKLNLFGPIAWLLRRFVYLMVIPTWKARFKVLVDWALHSFGHRYIIKASPDSTPSRSTN